MHKLFSKLNHQIIHDPATKSPKILILFVAAILFMASTYWVANYGKPPPWMELTVHYMLWAAIIISAIELLIYQFLLINVSGLLHRFQPEIRKFLDDLVFSFQPVTLMFMLVCTFISICFSFYFVAVCIIGINVVIFIIRHKIRREIYQFVAQRLAE